MRTWGVILAPALAGMVLAGCKPAAKGKARERVANVAVQILRPQEAEDRIELPGVVEAWADVRLSAEVEGRLESMEVDEGDTVSAEQVLFRIESSVLAARLDQAEAALKALKAEQEKIEAGARPEELAIAGAKVRAAEAAVKQAQAAVAQAHASEANAQRELARTQKLFDEGVESSERLDAVKTVAVVTRLKREAADKQLLASDEQLMATRKELALLREGARREDRDAIAARVAQAQAAVDLADITLKKAAVRSPITGVLNTRHCDVGEYLQVGAPVADIVNADRVKVVVPVPEKDISFVRTGALMTAVFDKLGGLEREGRVVYQSRTADRRTLTFEVKIELDNAEDLLRPGMVGRVDLVRRRVKTAIAVPIFAVVKRDEGYVVFLENGGQAHERPVTLGFFDGEKVIVTSGLQVGDRLIVMGHRDLAHGDKVQVATTASQPAPARSAEEDRP